MFKGNLILFVMILVSVEGAVTLTSNFTQISNYCSGTPYWKLNLCNITCDTCSSSDYNQCSSCEENFTLTNNYCKITNDSFTFIYLTYFTSTSIDTTELSLWSDASTSKNLSTADTVSVCNNATQNSYRFVMLGLFGINDDVNYQATFTQDFTHLTLKFNLLLLVNSVTLYVKLGEEQVYTQDYRSLADLTATYYKSLNQTTTNYLHVDALTTQNAKTVVQQVSIDLTLLTKSIDLHLVCTAPTPSNFWAISDFTILLRQCETCPKTALLSDLDDLGRIIGYTSAFLFPSLIIFSLLLKLKQYFRLKKRERILGSRSLPLKSIKRVISIICNLGRSKGGRSSAEAPRKSYDEIMEHLKKQNLKLTKQMSQKQEKENKYK